MPSYLKDDLKEVEISKQRVLDELSSLGIDMSLVDTKDATLESCEACLDQTVQMMREFPKSKATVAALINTLLSERRFRG